jgi:hypothetical protein
MRGMLLFPFWVMAVAALVLAGLVRLTQDRTTLSVVSFCFWYSPVTQSLCAIMSWEHSLFSS